MFIQVIAITALFSVGVALLLTLSRVADVSLGLVSWVICASTASAAELSRGAPEVALSCNVVQAHLPSCSVHSCFSRLLPCLDNGAEPCVEVGALS